MLREVQNGLKESFGRLKVENGLNTIQAKLSEFINKNYYLNNKEASFIHRDMTMKMIEINKMIQRLLSVLSDYKNWETNQKQQSNSKRKLKPMVAAEYDQENIRNSVSQGKLNRKLFHDKPGEKLQTRREAEDLDEELKAAKEFQERVGVIASNSEVILLRGDALVDEYRKIDENIEKLVRYLVHRGGSNGMVGKYKQYLHASRQLEMRHILEGVKRKELVLRNKTVDQLKESILNLKQEVNSLKEATKDRRDRFNEMLRQDKISVEATTR